MSPRSSLREPSAIRALQPLLAVPGMISLGGGACIRTDTRALNGHPNGKAMSELVNKKSSSI